MHGVIRAALVLTLLASSARADAPRDFVVYVGDTGPWLELLRAELSLVDLDLRRATVPPPASPEEAKDLVDAAGGISLVVGAADAVTVWAPTCSGMRPREVRDESPGAAALLVSETLWARVQTSCPDTREPDEDDAWILTTPAPALVGPRPALEVETPPAAAPPRLSLEASVSAGHDFGGARPTVRGWLGAHLHLHDRVGLYADGSLSLRDARIDHRVGSVRLRTSTLSAGARLRHDFGFGEAQLELGPAALFVHAVGDPHQTAGREQRLWLPAAQVALAVQLDLGTHLALRLSGRYQQSFRRVELQLGEARVGRLGPQLHTALGLVVRL